MMGPLDTPPTDVIPVATCSSADFPVQTVADRGSPATLSPPISLIGVLDAGPDTLAPIARRRIEEADLVVGDDRFLKLYAPLVSQGSQVRSFTGRLGEVPQWLENGRRLGLKVAVLATGDPLFFGLAGSLSRHLPPGSFEVLAQVSSLQLAFARLGRSWSEARWVSLHAQDGGDWHSEADFAHPLYSLWRAMQGAILLGVLTSPANSPARLARMLLALEWGESWTMTVCQRLGMADERIERALSPSRVTEEDFLAPNVVILERRRAIPEARWPAIGLPDEFYRKKFFRTGLITRREVRALALAYMEIVNGDRVWDIGAGSGSVGLEAAALTPDGQVWAIEKDAESVLNIQANRRRLGRYNYRVQCASAPDGMEAWPAPDAVFIGGSGGMLESLLLFVLTRMKIGGRLVINLVTLENLTRTLDCLKNRGQSWRLTQTGCSLDQPLSHMHRLEAQGPVWIVTAVKEAESS
ncbi:MAG: precorrin-6y C5,15-methyltransferase (decarboxylating) subunit CbiE [Magnetococcales bacterium]|nr:precorrin-6y C5,15-methyltransferase (decarboxylating) subunit CbiE [Magnetococcales bacterium]